MHRAFISYSSKDEAPARHVVQALEAVGIPCWLASRDIPEGSAYNREITSAIQAADIVVLIFSREADDSEEVQRELALAGRFAKKVCPINIDGYAPNHLQYWLLTTQWISMAECGDFETVANAVNTTYFGADAQRVAVTEARPIEVRATRFIPFYLAPAKGSPLFGRQTNATVAKRIGNNLARANVPGFSEVRLSADGVGVLCLRESQTLSSPIEFARLRRERHQQLIQANHLLDGLRPHTSNPLFKKVPPGIDYVMSVHQVLNAHELPVTHLYAMAEPSLIGITDDPKIDPADEPAAHHALATLRTAEAMKRVVPVPTKRNSYYVSWSNVLLCDPEPQSSDYALLEDLEFALQRLWYKLYFFSKHASLCLENTRRYDVRKCKAMIRSALGEYLSFAEYNSVGSSHSNQLKAELIRTSEIGAIADALGQKEKLL
jgi:hypothetical protein